MGTATGGMHPGEALRPSNRLSQRRGGAQEVYRAVAASLVTVLAWGPFGP
jgi:hypothetical protein